MAENSAIEWCDSTFNPWIGCTKVSPACDNCYAETLNKRWSGGANWGPKAPRQKTSIENWKKPLQWNRKAEKLGIRRRVFCASLADVFDNHKTILPEWRAELWALIHVTPHLDWLLLTKRPQNIKKMMGGWDRFPDNVWIGTTIENQEEADRRIPLLLEVKAKIRFLSMEPLLGPVDLFKDGLACMSCPRCADCGPDYETGVVECKACEGTGKSNESAIDWIIAGGESGVSARPLHPDWVRSLRNQCAVANVAFFFKQWGEWAPASQVAARGTVTHAMTDEGKISEFIRETMIKTDPWTTRWEGLRKTGKKGAGRLLDGREWNEFPVAA